MIKIQKSYGPFIIEEKATLLDVEMAKPLFFSVKFGQRETLDIYRGFVISRHTMTYSDGEKCRRTAVYMFGSWEREENNKCLTCISAKINFPTDMRAIKRKIDSIILAGMV